MHLRPYSMFAIALGTLMAFAVAPSSAQAPFGYSPVAPAGQELGELEFLAVDIARRAVLAHYPQAGHDPIRTIEVRVRPEGDVIHTFAKVQWSFTDTRGTRFHEAEVFSSLVYTPDVRRMFDISYKDNYLKPHRDCNVRIDLLSKFNEEFERRDPLRMPAPLIGRRMDFLAPRHPAWVWHCLSGDHAWHVNAADSHVDPAWTSVDSRVPRP